MTKQYNVWNKWDPLKKVVLGSCYHPNFFQDIKNNNIRSALTQIAEETLEDLDGFENVLKDFGCEVVRPYVDNNDNIMNYINAEGELSGRKIQRGPLQPRDGQVVIGNEIFITGYNSHLCPPSIRDMFLQEDNHYYMMWPCNGMPFEEQAYNDVKGGDWPEYNKYLELFVNHQNFSSDNEINLDIENCYSNYINNGKPFDFVTGAPNITVLGKDIYLNVYADGQSDGWPEHMKQEMIRHFTTKYKDFRVNTINVDGHSDGCYHAIKPGALLSLTEVQNYADTFPGWDVCYLPENGLFAIPEFWNLKQEMYGKWWVPGQEDNHEFNHFVSTWLEDWVGYCAETVFDVNVLVLDEHHVCVTNLNEDAAKFFKKHKIEPIIIPWRHRYFWDGGLHCITLDLVREGNQQDYFPDRKPIHDKGY